ncbi:MAG: hypothetical protein ACLSTV_01605 [Coriobacteriales bacterium]|jgi:lipoprotein
MKKAISLVLSAVLCLGALAACGGGREQNSAAEIVTLNGFGDYDEARRVMYESFVGDVDIVDSEFFDTKAARVTIEYSRQPEWTSTEYTEYSPKLIFDAIDEELGYDLTDITSVSSFGVDVYNDNEYDAILLFWIKSTSGIICDSYAELPAKTLTNAVFPLNPLESAGAGERCDGFVLAILDGRINDRAFTKRYYFDNFRAVCEREKSSAKMGKLCEDEEILFFEEEEDIRYVAPHHIDGQYGKITVPPGGIGYTADTPIGNALKLVAYGNKPYEAYDLSYYDEDMQKYGVKVADELVNDLDFTKLDGGCWSLTADVYNADAELTRGVYLILEDETGFRIENKLSLAPFTSGRLKINNAEGLDIRNIKGVYVMYDTYDIFRKAELYVSRIGFLKEA